MKKNPPFVSCAILALGMMAQGASAQTIVVQNSQGMGAKVTAPNSGSESYSQTYDKAYARFNGTTDAGKLWLQFDLTSTWATYGQANLTSATLTLWGENGTSRSFNVYGLNDNSGLEAWDMASLSWLTAPGNVPTDNTFDPTKTTLVWGAGTAGVNLANAALGSNFDQSARYVSPDIALTSFLATDTDGKVTFMLAGGNNQNWWVGTPGTYANDLANGFVSADPNTLGQVTRDSPTLTLTFGAVPEPGTLSLCLLGLGLGYMTFRRRIA